MATSYQKTISRPIVFSSSSGMIAARTHADMSETARRLQIALEARGVSQSALARGINVTQGAINAILSGKTRRSKHLVDIAGFLGVRVGWLIGFESEMEPDKAKEVLLRPTEQELIDNWRVLPLVHQSSVRQMMHDLALAELVRLQLLTLLPSEEEIAAILTDKIAPLDLNRPADEIAADCARGLRWAFADRDFAGELEKAQAAQKGRDGKS